MNYRNNKFRKNSIEERARKVFGETEYFELAGYLLRDGSMLNFSHEGFQRDDHWTVLFQGSGNRGFTKIYATWKYQMYVF